MFCLVVVVVVVVGTRVESTVENECLFVEAESTFEMIIDFENKPLFDLKK